MSLTNISKKYFTAFSNQDLETLGEMFSDFVRLRDWEIKVDGKKNVLEANKNIFDNLSSNIVNVVNMYECDRTIIADLLINLEEKQVIKVVDIIEFDENNLIKSIKAYKG